MFASAPLAAAPIATPGNFSRTTTPASIQSSAETPKGGMTIESDQGNSN